MITNKQKWLFFGSTNCNTCKRMLSSLTDHFKNIDLIYIDAFDDNKQDFCDKHDVEALPHIKIYSSSGHLILEHIGYISATEIEMRLIEK